MISANGGLPAHRYTPQVTPRWPRGSEPASAHTSQEATTRKGEAQARGTAQQSANAQRPLAKHKAHHNTHLHAPPTTTHQPGTAQPARPEKKKKKENTTKKQTRRREGKKKETKERGGKGHRMPTPKAPRDGRNRTPETRGAHKRGENKNPEATQAGQPQPGGGRADKESNKNGHRKGSGAPKRAREAGPPDPAKKARPRTHAQDPGVASPKPNRAVSASTRNSPGAPAESLVERRAVRETGRVSDRVHSRKPPQRTQPKTDAGGTRQGQPHGGAPNGYDAERAQRPCLGGGQRQAQ